MNEIVNNNLVARDKFMPEIISENKDLHIGLVDHLQKTRKE